METLGDYLKSKREAHNITLQEVSQATRIRRSILEAIEHNNYDLIPPKVFTQGFIKSYASYLDLDQNDAIKRYHEIMESLERTKAAGTPPVEQPPKGFLTPGRLLVVGILLILMLMTVWLLRRTPQTGNGTVLKGTPETVAPASVEPPPLTPEEISPGTGLDYNPLDRAVPASREEETSWAAVKGKETAGEVESGMAEAEPMVLRIAATEATWMKIQLDRSEPYEAYLKRGESLALSAREKFILRIGNGGGVELFFNGESLGSPGKPGEVINLTLPR